MTTRFCALLISCFPALAGAQTLDEVYRCEDAAGRRIFSDQPCSAMGAMPLPSAGDPAPPPRDRYASRPAENSGPEIYDPALLPTPHEADGCGGSDPQRLADVFNHAVATADTNRLAALFHWQGSGRGSASAVFRRIETWIQGAPIEARVVRAENADDWIYAGLAPPPPGSEPLPEIELGSPKGASLGRFSLIRNAGCVWLLPYRNTAARAALPAAEAPFADE